MLSALKMSSRIQKWFCNSFFLTRTEFHVLFSYLMLSCSWKAPITSHLLAQEVMQPSDQTADFREPIWLEARWLGGTL